MCVEAHAERGAARDPLRSCSYAPNVCLRPLRSAAAPSEYSCQLLWRYSAAASCSWARACKEEAEQCEFSFPF